jgi:hypothetical protein
MLRRAIIGLVPLLILAMGIQPVTAGKLWCPADPVVSLNQRLVDITVAIPADYLLLVNGPTSITIKTPHGVDGEVIVNDLGFMGYGTVITFATGGGTVKENEFPVDIKVSVPVDTSGLPANETVPLQVTVTPDNQLPITVTGTAESTVVQLTVTGR